MANSISDLEAPDVPLGWSDVADIFNQHEVEVYGSSNTTLTSYAPGDANAALISGMQTAITVETGDLFIFLACIPISGGSTSDIWYLIQNVSGTTISPEVCIFQAPTVNTSGKQLTLTMMTMFEAADVGTGSKNFETKWARESASGGTVYSRRRHQNIFRIKGFTA